MISSGIYGYPKAQALKVAVDTITSFLIEHDMLVYIVVFDKSAFQISEKLFSDIAAYIDDKYVDTHFIFNRSRRESWDKSTVLSETQILSDAPDTCKQQAPCCPSMAMPMMQPTMASEEPKEAMVSLDDGIIVLDESFSEMLLRKIDEKGMTDAQCYKKANVDRKLFSKIRNNVHYSPSKPTAIAFAIALEMDLEETKEFLEKAGYALLHSNKFDIIIEYFIQNENYNVFEINEALFAFDQNLLGC